MSEEAAILPPSLERDPLRLALDCLQEGFQVINFDWQYIYLNPAAARHGRRSARELIGKPIAEAYPGIDETPLFAVLRRSMEERTSHVLENEFTFPDGSTRWFEIRVQPFPDGICVYSSDIDHRKRRELGVEPRAQTEGRPSLARRIRQLFGRR
jgi:PAS domain S-box-containing protein